MKYQKGFTLIEIIVVIAIIGIIMSFGTIINLTVLKTNILEAEKSKIISVLEKARSRSMNNMFDTPHATCFSSPNYIIFRGRDTCLPSTDTDEIIPANTNMTTNFPTIVFERLTGKLLPQLTPIDSEISINISDDVKSTDIKINNEGRINW